MRKSDRDVLGAVRARRLTARVAGGRRRLLPWPSRVLSSVLLAAGAAMHFGAAGDRALLGGSVLCLIAALWVQLVALRRNLFKARLARRDASNRVGDVFE